MTIITHSDDDTQAYDQYNNPQSDGEPLPVSGGESPPRTTYGEQNALWNDARHYMHPTRTISKSQGSATEPPLTSKHGGTSASASGLNRPPLENPAASKPQFKEHPLKRSVRKPSPPVPPVPRSSAPVPPSAPRTQAQQDKDHKDVMERQVEWAKHIELTYKALSIYMDDNAFKTAFHHLLTDHLAPDTNIVTKVKLLFRLFKTLQDKKLLMGKGISELIRILEDLPVYMLPYLANVNKEALIWMDSFGNLGNKKRANQFKQLVDSLREVMRAQYHNVDVEINGGGGEKECAAWIQSKINQESPTGFAQDLPHDIHIISCGNLLFKENQALYDLATAAKTLGALCARLSICSSRSGLL